MYSLLSMKARSLNYLLGAMFYIESQRVFRLHNALRNKGRCRNCVAGTGERVNLGRRWSLKKGWSNRRWPEAIVSNWLWWQYFILVFVSIASFHLFLIWLARKRARWHTKLRRDGRDEIGWTESRGTNKGNTPNGPTWQPATIDEVNRGRANSTSPLEIIEASQQHQVLHLCFEINGNTICTQYDDKTTKTNTVNRREDVDVNVKSPIFDAHNRVKYR